MEINSDQLPTYIHNKQRTDAAAIYISEGARCVGGAPENFKLEALWKYVSFGRGLQCVFSRRQPRKSEN